MTEQRIVSVLRGILGEENLLVAPLPKDYEIDGVQPTVVASPATIEAAAEILAAAHREGWVVVPRGGGTAMHLGNVPPAANVILSTLHLNAPVVHNPADLTATAQAGISIADLQRTLGENGQFLPVDPPFSNRATLGGIVAADTFGPNRQGYGTLRDQVLGVTVIHADGTITRGGGRVVKNVAGYDMPKLYIGSLGTLGVIVEVNLRLLPRPEARRTIMGFFAGAEAAYRAFAPIFGSALVPTAFALLNPSALAALRDAASLECPGERWCLIIGCEETAAAVDRQITQMGGVLEGHGSEGVLDLDGAAEAELWEAVRHLPYRPRTGSQTGEAGTLLLRASVPTSRVVETMEAAEEAGGNNSLATLLSAYVGAGVVYCSLSPAAGSTLSNDACVSVVTRLRQVAGERGGHVVVEQAPLAVKKQLEVWGPTGGFPIMQAIKRQFDPDGILNPGRFVGRL